MTETAVEEKTNGIPVPEEGTEEFARMNKMAKIAIPIVLIIFTMGVLQQQAFGMIYVNIGDQLGQANLAPLITSIPGIVLGIVCVIYGSLGDFVSLKKMMILGTIVFVLGSILGCFGDLSIWIVIAARTVQSAGWQVSGSIFLVLVSKYIEKKKRVIWYGVFVAVFRIAAALGVFLAGYMTLVDWRILFGIGIIAVFFIPILAKNLPDEHAKGRARRRDRLHAHWPVRRLGDHVLHRHDHLLGYRGAGHRRGLRGLHQQGRGSVHHPGDAHQPGLRDDHDRHLCRLLLQLHPERRLQRHRPERVRHRLLPGLQPAGVVDHPRRHHGLRRWPDHPEDRPQGLHHSGARLHGRWPDRRCVPDSDGQIWALAVAPCIYYFGTSFFYQPIVDTATLTVEAEESGRALGFNDLMQAITGSVGVAIFGQLMANGAMSGGSLFGTESGPASTYANVFMVGGIIVLGAMVIFICSMKMIYSRSRVAEDES